MAVPNKEDNKNNYYALGVSYNLKHFPTTDLKYAS